MERFLLAPVWFAVTLVRPKMVHRWEMNLISNHKFLSSAMKDITELERRTFGASLIMNGRMTYRDVHEYLARLLRMLAAAEFYTRMLFIAAQLDSNAWKAMNCRGESHPNLPKRPAMERGHATMRTGEM